MYDDYDLFVLNPDHTADPSLWGWYWTDDADEPAEIVFCGPYTTKQGAEQARARAEGWSKCSPN